jgi:hypothetical protein
MFKSRKHIHQEVSNYVPILIFGTLEIYNAIDSQYEYSI